jgi:hypothetical protein
MFYRPQNQHHSAAQRPIGGDYRRVQKALSILEPLSGVTLSVFIAGILVPSFLPSGMAANREELLVADKCFIDGCKAKPTWWAETPLGLVYSCSEHKHHLAGFKSQGPLDPT